MRKWMFEKKIIDTSHFFIGHRVPLKRHQSTWIFLITNNKKVWIRLIIVKSKESHKKTVKIRFELRSDFCSAAVDLDTYLPYFLSNNVFILHTMGRLSLECFLVVFVCQSYFVLVSSQTNSLSNLQIGVGPTGQVLLLLILLMVALFGIPMYLWVWRNYLKKIVSKVTGKVQVRNVKVDKALFLFLKSCLLLSDGFLIFIV